jgi:hypothetical protein
MFPTAWAEGRGRLSPTVLKLLKMATGMRALLDTVVQALPQVRATPFWSPAYRGLGWALRVAYVLHVPSPQTYPDPGQSPVSSRPPHMATQCLLWAQPYAASEDLHNAFRSPQAGGGHRHLCGGRGLQRTLGEKVVPDTPWGNRGRPCREGQV